MTRTALILAAHGSHHHDDANATIHRWAKTLRQTTNYDTATAAFHHGQPNFADVLDTLPDIDRAVIIPVMTSRGYYTECCLETRIAENQRAQSIPYTITEPLGCHARIPTLVSDRIRHLIAHHHRPAANPTVLLVGHGTRRHTDSSTATLDLARDVRPHVPGVTITPAFLDQDPLLEDVVKRYRTGDLLIVPFLISRSAHAIIDIPRRLGLTPTPAPITRANGDAPPAVHDTGNQRVIIDRPIGADPRIIDLLAEIARSAQPLDQHRRPAPVAPPPSSHHQPPDVRHPHDTDTRHRQPQHHDPATNGEIGCVYLVGAGPGDPDLITVRGARCLASADAVLHDGLVSPQLLAIAPPRARLISVAKQPSRSNPTQSSINALLIELARSGRRVVRLKGGDPFLFGRGIEELIACRQAGVPCHVIPGVTSALAAPAAAHIPLTHRGTARSVAIVTARFASRHTGAANRAAPVETLDYDALARMDTLVILMGRSTLADVTRSLIAAGKPPDTPAACIQHATTPRQRTVRDRIDRIAEAADRAGLTAPMVTVIGTVTDLPNTLDALDNLRATATGLPPATMNVTR